jgi:glutathione S-transferase
MKIYGSKTSPYVRRIRLALGDEFPYEFINLNIFEEKDRNTLRKLSPVLKIPVLEDGENVVYDSRQIFYYLVHKGMFPRLTLEQENLLTIIDGVNDLLINKLLLKRSDVELPEGVLLSATYQDRLELSLPLLDKYAKETRDWSYVEVCLFCLLDWSLFRNMLNWKPYTGLVEFWEKSKSRPAVMETSHS